MKELKYLKICIEKAKIMELTPFMIERLEDVFARLQELETLKQPKSCDGCKFHADVGWDDWCCDCIRKWTIDRYEAKEQ